MNKAMIRYILGYVLSILALLLLLPCLVALIYQEMEGFHYLGGGRPSAPCWDI